MNLPTSSLPPDASAVPDEPLTGSPIRWFQLRLARIVGVSASERRRIVLSMMMRAPSEAAGYWLQLCLSVCIATFGLVLNSSGVVIGAMLIAPLMGPIVELAMALTIGSPFLTLRSLLRIAISILIAVAGSTTINLLVPFHEVTAEIAARTTPTALDLFVAIFCALAAAFSVVRASSETVATAAGTSISIALVPPLCVVGFGAGNLQWPVALGAALLFVANLSAILMFAALFFLSLGFDLVDAQAIEQEAAAEKSWVGQMAKRGWSLFGHRYGRGLRVLVPLLLVGAVYVPLSKALSTVAWEVRVRGQVQSILEQELPRDLALQSTVVVKRQMISLRLVLISKPERAKDLERQLRLRIAQASGVDPIISVLAVPDEQAVRETALTLSNARHEPLPPPLPPEPDWDALRKRLNSRIAAEWPAEAAGAILNWRLSFTDKGAVLHVSHLGPPLGAAAEQLLSRRLGDELGIATLVQDRAIDPGEHAVEIASTEGLWPELVRAITAVSEHSELSLCLWLPPDALPQRPSAADLHRKTVLDSIRQAVAGLGARAALQESDRLRLRVQREPCVAPAAPDGGTGGRDAGVVGK